MSRPAFILQRESSPKNMAASVSLESLPVILETPHFAMKDGTVINLFVQKMLRLSVVMPLLNF